METNKKNTAKDENQIPDFLNYPPSEDIYNMGKEEKDIDPEDPTKKKTFDAPNSLAPSSEETDNAHLGSDLDIPGVEFDNWQVDIANEDEENDYYSIGGDNHTDLEETNDDVV